jgi:Tol biopolymer transport system component
LFLGLALFSPAASAQQGQGGGPAVPGAQAAAPSGIPADELRRIPGRIAFISERDGNRELYLLRPGEQAPTRLTQSPDAADFPAAATRDGSAILSISVEEKDGLHLEQLWLRPLDGKAARAMGPRAGKARNPSWSPDGRWFVFESDSESFSDLYRQARDGGKHERLTRTKDGCFEPALSPDGAWIAFVSSREGDPEIYRMRADGKAEQRLTAFHREDWSPRWSPDGKRIAFLSSREGVDRIFVMDANGTRLKALTGARAKDDPEESAPVWSPDGTRIAYVGKRKDERARLWVADARTGAKRALTDGKHPDEAPEWSPDGRYLAFVSERDGDAELYLVRSDGSGPTRLTRSPKPDWLPRWIPDAPAKTPARGR